MEKLFFSVYLNTMLATIQAIQSCLKRRRLKIEIKVKTRTPCHGKITPAVLLRNFLQAYLVHEFKPLNSGLCLPKHCLSTKDCSGLYFENCISYHKPCPFCLPCFMLLASNFQSCKHLSAGFKFFVYLRIFVMVVR